MIVLVDGVLLKNTYLICTEKIDRGSFVSVWHHISVSENCEHVAS
jgi:hypothetical protein